MKSYGNRHGEYERVSLLVLTHRWYLCIPTSTLAIIGLQGFFPLKGQAAVGVGSIEYPAAERKRLAAL